MAVFKLFDHTGLKFNVNPKPGKALSSRGWFIDAHCSDRTKFGGQYVRTVGFADERPTGVVPFKTRRAALAAIAEGINFGLLIVEEGK